MHNMILTSPPDVTTRETLEGNLLSLLPAPKLKVPTKHMRWT